MPEPILETSYDVIVEVNAVGLNPVDTKIRNWFKSLEIAHETWLAGLMPLV
jgi:NADPH:quinone reductase-like Zn-dependent oxidoreductase